jgi:hypothetical protein
VRLTASSSPVVAPEALARILLLDRQHPEKDLPMPAPASPLRIRHTAARRSAPSVARFGGLDGVSHRLNTDGDGGRLQALAGALFLLALTVVSGSLLYSFARGPSAPPLLSASTH